MCQNFNDALMDNRRDYTSRTITFPWSQSIQKIEFGHATLLCMSHYFVKRIEKNVCIIFVVLITIHRGEKNIKCDEETIDDHVNKRERVSCVMQTFAYSYVLFVEIMIYLLNVVSAAVLKLNVT